MTPQISSSHASPRKSIHDPTNSRFSTLIGLPTFRLSPSLNNLDYDNLLATLDNMPLDDLIQVASTNETIRAIIGYNYLIDFYNIQERRILIASANHQHNPENDMKIEDPYLAEEFLHLFGSLVSKIVVLGYEFTYSEGEMISRAIANNCNNLIEIHMENVGFHLISQTNRTFSHVKQITFVLRHDLDLDQIHRIYPAVEKLTIELSATPLITVNNPNIEQIRRLLPRIPHLKSLTLSGILSNSLLQSIKNNLPVLEEMRIVYDTTTPPTQQIHFKSVKSLSITPIKASTRASSNNLPISFDNLENLAIYTSHYSLIPIKLIEDSDQLEEFSLPWTLDKYGVDYIVELLMRKKYLEKVTLRYSMEQPAANTISLIGSFHGIDELTFVMWDKRSSVLQRDILISLIPDDWQIKRLTRGRHFGQEAYHLTIVH